jgi:tetratricopeptide (TPR) repeat protein
MSKKKHQLRKTGPETREISALINAINEKKYTQAINLAKTFTQLFPQYPFGWMALGTSLKLIERNEEAIVALEKAIKLAPKDAALLNDLGSIQLDMGEVIGAEINFRRALQINPDFPQAYTNLGMALEQLGNSDEAELCHKRAIILMPNFTEAYYNLGITFRNLGKLTEAILSFKKAIAIKPDYFEALNNLGITSQEIYDQEAAEIAFRNAITIKPNFAEAYFNLGNTYHSLGKLNDAVFAFQQAFLIRQDFAQAINNMGCVLEEQEKFLEAEVCYRKAAEIDSDFLEAKQNLAEILTRLGKQNEADDIYHRILKPNNSSISKNQQITALMPIGRSGSLFFHSLFDEHPEILTLPGVYFKGWFDDGLWNKQFKPDTKNHNWRIFLAKNIINTYEPFFDAKSKKNVPGNPMDSDWLAKDMGFMEMGADRSQHLVIEKDKFLNAFLSLLAPLTTVTQADCFTFIHRAFEMAVRGIEYPTTQENKVIFYHIHNPNLHELTNFLQSFPKAKLIYIVRNPVQSMESWMLTATEGIKINSTQVCGNDISKNIKEIQFIGLKKWNQMVHLIFGMFKYLQLPLTKFTDSRGIRLEDVKRTPFRVLPQIAEWIGVSDNPALYASSFCGLQYWGPTSKTTGKITGFDTSSIDRVKGELLGSRDIRIFETLFWPFSKLYGYTSMDVEEFRSQLYEIRPWLEVPLEFEAKLYAELPDHTQSIQELYPYKRLHRLLHNYWNILNRDGTYHAMVPPFKFT